MWYVDLSISDSHLGWLVPVLGTLHNCSAWESYHPKTPDSVTPVLRRINWKSCYSCKFVLHDRPLFVHIHEWNTHIFYLLHLSQFNVFKKHLLLSVFNLFPRVFIPSARMVSILINSRILDLTKYHVKFYVSSPLYKIW